MNVDDLRAEYARLSALAVDASLETIPAITCVQGHVEAFLRGKGSRRHALMAIDHALVQIQESTSRP